MGECEPAGPERREPASRDPAASAGEPRSAELLFSLVYDELRGLAHGLLIGERSGHTLNTTALVHEAYLRLSSRPAWDFGSRDQFFAVAGRAMRRILVDYARRAGARKRPPRSAQESLGAIDAAVSSNTWDVVQALGRADLVVQVDAALEELRSVDERLVRVVEYRFFLGLSETEAADLLGVTRRTVIRDWLRARGWLYQRLGGVPTPNAATR